MTIVDTSAGERGVDDDPAADFAICLADGDVTASDYTAADFP